MSANSGRGEEGKENGTEGAGKRKRMGQGKGREGGDLNKLIAFLGSSIRS